MNISSERGVIIPLLAVISLTVIFALVVLGVNATRFKYASTDLRAEANTICEALAKLPLVNQREIAVSFARKVNDYATRLPPNVVLEGATVIVPTMPLEFGLPSGFSAAEQDLDYNPADKRPYISQPTPGFDICESSLRGFFNIQGACEGGDFCQDNPGKCIFQGDVHHTIAAYASAEPGTMGQRYPVSLFHNRASAGNSIICELRANVQNFFFGTSNRSTSARVAFWQPAVGYPTYSPADGVAPQFPPGSNPNPADARLPYPGLTIAIATEMTTSANDPRFEFTNPPFSSLGGITWTNFNPLPSGGADVTFSGPSGSHSYSSGNGVEELSPPAPGILRNDMRVACMNPAVLVRNAYLQTLVELLSRHGHFRNTTEVLHINPQQRLTDPTNYAVISNGGSFPTIIARMGADIAEQRFQHPFVFFFGDFEDVGGPGSPNAQGISMMHPSEFGPSIGAGDRFADGYVNPFSEALSGPLGPSSSGVSPATVRYHSLLASQLRSCFHLYSRQGGGITDGTLYTFNPFLPALNLEYEPPGVYDSALTLANGGFTAGTPWAQRCPWDLASCPPGFSRSLSVAEVVASLGTTQICPYEFDYDLDGSSPPERCIKPVRHNDPHMGPYDLRPDIHAALRYMGNLSWAPVVLGSGGSPAPFGTVNMRAIASPGLFPIQATDVSGSWAGLTNPNFPFLSNASTPQNADGIYPAPRTTSSSIILVLHQRLSNHERSNVCTSGTTFNRACDDPSCISNEVCRIRCVVEELTTKNRQTGALDAPRPITVLYFPTTYTDFSAEALDNLRCAFNAQFVATDSTRENLLIPFVPTNTHFTSAPGSSCSTEVECFLKYWHWLLTDPEHGVIAQARLHFLERYTATGVKF